MTSNTQIGFIHMDFYVCAGIVFNYQQRGIPFSCQVYAESRILDFEGHIAGRFRNYANQW